MKKLILTVLAASLIGCNNPAPQSTPSAASPAPATTTTPASSETPGATGTPSAEGATFEKELSLQEHTYKVTATPSGEMTKVMVSASGPEMAEAEAEVSEINGTVTEAEIEDLNSDGFPEVYIYATSNTEKKEGILVAYASNNGKSLSQISVPSIDTVEGADGYQGGDEFRVVETTLVQRYPLEDGKHRQIEWKLEPGESTWVLNVDKIETY